MLRDQLTQVRKQLEAAVLQTQTANAEDSNKFAGYITREHLSFVGFGSPENALQSMRWAEENGDYTNWLASLAPALQEEELANPRSRDEFQQCATSRFTGMQILGAKPVGNDRVELKVLLDTENSVIALIFPMVNIGNEWRLGDEIHSYKQGLGFSE